MRSGSKILVFLWLGSAAIMRAQDRPASEPQQPTFRTGTRTVALYATVTDSQKRLVPDLTQEDFAP